MRLVSLGIAALAFCSLVPAQSRNVTLLGRLDLHGSYNDVWGYAAPDGREYALLGISNGMAVVNTTDPRNPREVGFFPGPSSTWRDMRTLGAYAYVVTEATGGMQIIDLTNPDAPRLVTTWGGNRWSRAHNICIDTGTGWIYICGTGGGTRVIDASTNPTNPTWIGSYPGYLHDLHVQNGLGHGSEIRNGTYKLFDVTSWPFRQLSRTPTPNSFTHNAWPNANDTVAVTTDERTGAVAQFWDITNRNAPRRLGSYTPNTAAIPHNAFIVGDICHMSFYTEGYRAVDISDPANPVEAGYYDTWPGSSGGFNGAWGCYPFQPSGNVYVSDRATGLYIVKLNRLSIDHTPLSDTTDEIGPYTVTATAVGDPSVSSVRLDWSVNGGSNNTAPMQPTGNPDEFSADIPGQLAPATVAYSIVATNANGSVSSPTTGDYTFTVGTLTRLLFENFENGTNGWTHGLTRNQDDWQLGSPNGRSGTSSGVSWSDPSSAYSGSNCWGNDLGPSGWNGRYQGNTSNWLQSPSFPTTGAQGLKLRFRRWLTVEQGRDDQARVWVNGRRVWANPLSSHTVDTSWQQIEIDISSVTNSASNVQLRFTLDTDGGLHLGGWNIDDVELLSLSDCVPPQYYGTGTAGTGGLVPTIGTQGHPELGSSTFAVTGANMLANANAFLGFGAAAGNTTVLGLTLLVDPLVVVIGAPVDGAGTTSLTIPIPNDPSLDNIDIYTQWIVIDPGSPGGYVSGSRGVRFRICSG